MTKETHMESKESKNSNKALFVFFFTPRKQFKENCRNARIQVSTKKFSKQRKKGCEITINTMRLKLNIQRKQTPCFFAMPFQVNELN